MSIPKEPRQLMINLMYLVLTAMLALNVSAEVMNAFFTLDAGNNETMAVVESQLDATVSGLESLLENPEKAKFKPIKPAIDEVRALTSQFDSYIADIRNKLIDGSGNRDGEVNEGDFKEDHAGELKYIRGKKDKDVTTRLLVDGTEDSEPIGPQLEAKINETRAALIAAYSKLITENGKTFGLKEDEIEKRIQSVANEMPFGVNDEEWQEAGSDSWTAYKFRQMPVAAVLPLLSRMQADLSSAEANMVNDMASLVGGRTIEFNEFFPVVSADRSYVVSGEKIDAKVSVGTYSSSLDPSNVTITANGSPLRVGADGSAQLPVPTGSMGQKTINLGVRVRNPLTGEVNEGTGKFVYEVGSRSVAVSADKMNVFYMGVQNPISVSASGVSSNDVRVSGSGPISVSGSYPSYTITANNPGDAKINVTAKGQSLGSFTYRVKRIPDPVARLGKADGGAMGNGAFKAQPGLIAWLDNFDFDAKCQIQGYKLVRVPKRQDPITVVNPGGKFNGDAQRIVRAATPGDTYYFQDVKGRCPGDKAGRKLNSLIFNIR